MSARRGRPRQGAAREPACGPPRGIAQAPGALSAGTERKRPWRGPRDAGMRGLRVASFHDHRPPTTDHRAADALRRCDSTSPGTAPSRKVSGKPAGTRRADSPRRLRRAGRRAVLAQPLSSAPSPSSARQKRRVSPLNRSAVAMASARTGDFTRLTSCPHVGGRRTSAVPPTSGHPTNRHSPTRHPWQGGQPARRRCPSAAMAWPPPGPIARASGLAPSERRGRSLGRQPSGSDASPADPSRSPLASPSDNRNGTWPQTPARDARGGTRGARRRRGAGDRTLLPPPG
jgi:hypothetical protein